MGRGRLAPNMRGAFATLFFVLLLLGAGCGEPGRQSPPENLVKAREAFQAGLYLEAEAAFEEFIQAHPGHEARWEAWSRLTDIALSVKNDPDKGLALQEAMLLEFGDDSERAAIILLRIGDIHLTRGRLEDAVEAWRKAEQLELESGKYLPFIIRLARAFRDMGDYEQARQLFARCLEQTSGPAIRAECEYDLALTYSFLENWAMAQSILEEMLSEEQTRERMDAEQRSVTAFLLADMYAQQGEVARARELLEAIRVTHPNPMAVDAKLKVLEDM